jgi:hypothetical protein
MAGGLPWALCATGATWLWQLPLHRNRGGGKKDSYDAHQSGTNVGRPTIHNDEHQTLSARRTKNRNEEPT